MCMKVQTPVECHDLYTIWRILNHIIVAKPVVLNLFIFNRVKDLLSYGIFDDHIFLN